MDTRKSRNLLSITIIFFWASEYCHSPYFTPYLQTLGFGATIIGVMTGIYGFTQAAVRIPLGFNTDRTGYYKGTIVAGTFFTTISSFGLMFARSAFTIILCRMLAGMAASTWIAFTVLYNAYYKADESVTAMTGVNAFNNAGKLLAFFLGILTASYWGYKAPLFCSFATGVIAIICAFQLKPIEVAHGTMHLSAIPGIVRNPSILWTSFFGIVLQFFTQGTVFSFTSAVAKDLGASAFEIGLSSLLYTLIQVVIASYIGKVFLKKTKTVYALMTGFLFFAASALAIAFAQHMFFIYLGQCLAGIGNAILIGLLMAMVVRYMPQEKQSTAMGFYQAIYGVGMALGPFTMGSLSAANGYKAAYLFDCGLVVLAALLSPLAMHQIIRYNEKER